MINNIDEHLEVFIEDIGRTEVFQEVSQETIKAFKNKVPDKLLEYWRMEGFRAYGNGIVWITDPERYTEIITFYLKGTSFETLDRFYAFYINAFGDIRAIGEKTNYVITINVPDNSIIATSKSKPLEDMEKRNKIIQSEFVVIEKEDNDYYDIKTNQSLFDQAYDKFGMLKADEVYAFKKPLCDDGVPTIDNIEVQNIFEYITNIRALGTPKVPFSGVQVDTENMTVSKS
jgi:hypothetical protein